MFTKAVIYRAVRANFSQGQFSLIRSHQMEKLWWKVTLKIWPKTVAGDSVCGLGGGSSKIGFWSLRTTVNQTSSVDAVWFHAEYSLCVLPLLFLLSVVLIQKRLKKEKRNKRRLQEALEEEVKLRDQAEHSLLHTANTHTGTGTEAFSSSSSFFFNIFPFWLVIGLKLFVAGVILIFILNVTKPSVQHSLDCSLASN